MSAVDRGVMRRALRLAERGWGQVHPNPLVGAVLVKDGAILAEGWHAVLGGPHAEVVALQAAGAAARGATLYVSLEPCAHTGRTPPCTEAILAAGVRRVVIAAADPNPLAQGGAERLRAAGVEVVEGVLEEEARRQNAPFFHWHERGTPWVALKLAMTVDGAIGGARGPRVLITGEPARTAATRLRAGFDAILVGSRTVLVDDPLLTVRGKAARVPPVRVVLDSAARLSPGCRLLRGGAAAPVLVFTGPGADPDRTGALREAGADVVPVPGTPAGLDLDAVLGILGGRDVRSILCEGGAHLARALLAADRVERLYLFLAPRLFGTGGLKVFEGWPGGPGSQWRLLRHLAHGGDLEIVLERDRSSA